MYWVEETATEWHLIRPDGTVCAWYPKSEPNAEDAIRNLCDAINQARAITRAA